MANRFENGWPPEGFDRWESFLSDVRDVLEEHGKSVDRRKARLRKGQSYLNLTKRGKTVYEVRMGSRIYDFDKEKSVFDEAVITLPKGSEDGSLHLYQGIDKKGGPALLHVSINYGPINKHDEAVLFNPKLVVTKPNASLYEYSTEDRGVGYWEGMGLTVDADEAGDLYVQLDPDSEALIFPERYDLSGQLGFVRKGLRSK